MLKGIVFDLDGTLVDSLSVTFQAFNHGITQHGGREHTPAEIMAYFGPGETQILAKLLGQEKADAAYKACREYMEAHMHDVPLHEGVGSLLENLKSAGTPISIFTGRGWDSTEMILKHHGLLDRFITVVAHDHVNSPKPSPEGLKLALSKMSLSANEVLMVGDSPSDLRAAHGAGSQGVAALWDLLADRKALEAHNPHHWAKCPSDVFEIWQKLKK